MFKHSEPVNGSVVEKAKVAGYQLRISRSPCRATSSAYCASLCLMRVWKRSFALLAPTAFQSLPTSPAGLRLPRWSVSSRSEPWTSYPRRRVPFDYCMTGDSDGDCVLVFYVVVDTL